MLIELIITCSLVRFCLWASHEIDLLLEFMNLIEVETFSSLSPCCLSLSPSQCFVDIDLLSEIFLLFHHHFVMTPFQSPQPQTLLQRRHHRAAAPMKLWKCRLTPPCHPAPVWQRKKHKETETWRWLQRRRKKRKLYAFSTAPSAKWLSTLPPSSKPTTVVRNVVDLTVCTVFDTLLIWFYVCSGTKHKTMLEARSGDGAIKSFPRTGVKAKLAAPSELSTGLQNKTFHCEICDVHVNSETQLKQVSFCKCLVKKNKAQTD